MEFDAFEISLRPYKGRLYFAPTRERYAAAHIELFKESDMPGPHTGGRTTMMRGPDNQRTFLVWADGLPELVHELGHVVLDTFSIIGADPRDNGEEPFCYLLEQLFEECMPLLSPTKV